MDPTSFKDFRLKYVRRLEFDICSKKNPFNVLCQYLYRKRDAAKAEPAANFHNQSQNSSKLIYPINYDKLLSMIPENLGSKTPSDQNHLSTVRDIKQKLMASNLSDIQEELKKSVQSLERFALPKTRKFDSNKCLIDIKEERKLSGITPNRKLLRSDSKNSSSGQSSVSDNHDLIEYTSPIFVASALVKQGT